MKQSNSFNAFQVIEYSVMLIRAMNIIGIKPKAKQNRIKSKFFFKEGNNGNTPSSWGGDGFYAKRFPHGFACRSIAVASKLPIVTDSIAYYTLSGLPE